MPNWVRIKDDLHQDLVIDLESVMGIDYNPHGENFEGCLSIILPFVSYTCEFKKDNPMFQKLKDYFDNKINKEF